MLIPGLTMVSGFSLLSSLCHWMFTCGNHQRIFTFYCLSDKQTLSEISGKSNFFSRKLLALISQHWLIVGDFNIRSPGSQISSKILFFIIKRQVFNVKNVALQRVNANGIQVSWKKEMMQLRRGINDLES